MSWLKNHPLEHQAMDILEHYVPPDQLERVRAALNLPSGDSSPQLQERTYAFENQFGQAHIEMLLANGYEASVYVVFLPWDSDRLPTRNDYCINVADALQKICWAGDQLHDPYVLKRWWVREASDGDDLQEWWRDRQRHHSPRYVGISPQEDSRLLKEEEE